MKHSLLCLAVFIFSLNAQAISFRVQTTVNKTIISDLESFSASITAGKATMYFLERALRLKGINFDGDESGIRSIAGLDNRVEVISDRVMHAYGWCYSVDGIAPEAMPDKYLIKNPNANVLWFYAYSTYDNGKWITQCVPAQKIPPEKDH